MSIQFSARPALTAQTIRFGGNSPDDISTRRAAKSATAQQMRTETDVLIQYTEKEEAINALLDKVFIKNEFGTMTGYDVLKAACQIVVDYPGGDLALGLYPLRRNLFSKAGSGLDRSQMRQAFHELESLGLIKKKFGISYPAIPRFGFTMTPLGDYIISQRNPELYEAKKDTDERNAEALRNWRF